MAIAPHLAVVICDTRAERQLGATAYGERRAQCEDGVAHLRAIDPAITALRDVSPALLAAHEAELPPVGRAALPLHRRGGAARAGACGGPAGGRSVRAGRLLDASWRRRHALFEIGAPAMTAMHEAMRDAPGLIARRQAGAGFGGCLVAFVEQGTVAAFSAHVRAGLRDGHGHRAADLPRRSCRRRFVPSTERTVCGVRALQSRPPASADVVRGCA